MLSSNQQFVIQLLTIVTGFVVTLAGLYAKHRADEATYRAQNATLDHVNHAVNGVPGEPTVKQTAQAVHAAIQTDIVPRLADVQQTTHTGTDVAVEALRQLTAAINAASVNRPAPPAPAAPAPPASGGSNAAQ